MRQKFQYEPVARNVRPSVLYYGLMQSLTTKCVSWNRASIELRAAPVANETNHKKNRERETARLVRKDVIPLPH